MAFKKKIAYHLLKMAHKLVGKEEDFPKIQYVRVQKWFRDNQHKNLRVADYPLTKESIVFDVGGYHGDWASDIYNEYQCTIYIFEPVKKYQELIANRFKGNSKIQLFPFGLSGKTEQLSINLSADASSVFTKGEDAKEIVGLRSINDFLQENNIQKVDLMKLNIEGGEFSLLESLLQKENAQLFYNLQIQFHDFVEDAYLRMIKIQNQLLVTHDIVYQYPFVWERWSKKR